MPLTEDLLEAAPELAAGVVRSWRALAETFHWSAPHDAIDENHLATVIRMLGMAALARAAGESSPSRDLVRAALQHGRDRRDDGFTEEMLFREYHLLRRGLWEQLRQKDATAAAETIVRLDAEISMATSASLHGFHADGSPLDEEATVDTIVERWAT